MGSDAEHLKTVTCMVRCVSNKVDEIKETRSVTLNFDLKGPDGELLGKGNNLTINNLTAPDYRDLCRLFGLESVNDRTPFMAEMMVATEHEKLEAWKERWGEVDAKIDKSQSKVKDFDGEEEAEATGEEPPTKKRGRPPKKEKGSE